MATKKELSNAIEGLAEQMAELHGATIIEKTIKVGGRETQSRVAEGGMFNLDTCRGLVMHALRTHKDLIINHLPMKQAAPPGNAGGPRLGPNGQVVMGEPVQN